MGFQKSRNIKQLIFYLKYFILIREWFKESQTNYPEHIDETIYYLGQGYAFFWQNMAQIFYLMAIIFQIIVNLIII